MHQIRNAGISYSNFSKKYLRERKVKGKGCSL
jgi:hypothetical protein